MSDKTPPKARRIDGEDNDEIRGNLASPGQSEVADAIRRAIGAGPTEEISVYAPPHRSRLDGKEITYFPLTLAEFEALRHLRRETLIEIGLRPWDDSGLLLFPCEWYGLIPEDFEVVSIFGDRERFAKNKTDDDARFGVLAYGIIPEPTP